MGYIMTDKYMWPREQLLREAYPEGFLAMKGVSTTNGYLYMGDNVWVEKESLSSTPTVAVIPYKGEFSEIVQAGQEDTEALLERGDFLPNLDDPATWECAKRDFARLLFRKEPGTTWDRGLTWTKFRGGWLLATANEGYLDRVMIVSSDEDDNIGMGSTPLLFCKKAATDDRVEALLQARATVLRLRAAS